MASSKSFIKANSCTEPSSAEAAAVAAGLARPDSAGVVTEMFALLSNVRFAVFALGSSAYPNFCAFGKYVDNLLGELGGERILKLETGDEMCGQEQAFQKWATNVFRVACETFCLDDDSSLFEATQAFKTETLSPDTVRFVEAMPDELGVALNRCYNRSARACRLDKSSNLHGSDASRATLCLHLCLEDAEYEPGDHVGVFAENRAELVDGIIGRLQSCDPDRIVELQLEKESHTSNGVVKSWEPHPRLPRCSLRTLLTRFLDVTTPPTPQMLQWLSTWASDEEEQTTLRHLATDSGAYEDWRHWRFPHLLEVLKEFSSVRPPAGVLCAQLTPLQPRFYSISSSPLAHPGQVHLTVAVVSYRTQDGKGAEHFGVCSNFLKNATVGQTIYLFVRSAPGFHLPADTSRPVILVGPGTGIAPFRGFWQHRRAQLASSDSLEETDVRNYSERLDLEDLITEFPWEQYKRNFSGTRELEDLWINGKRTKSVSDLVDFYEGSTPSSLGSVWLFFGCRQRALDLYQEEKAQMLSEGVLDQVFLALSREKDIPKTYVQDLLQREAAEVYRKLVLEGGHFYVCGDCTMAEHVYQRLKRIIQDHGSMTENQVERYMLKLRDESRYHEDIFGITLRTAEVHNRSRESARIRMASQSQ